MNRLKRILLATAIVLPVWHYTDCDPSASAQTFPGLYSYLASQNVNCNATGDLAQLPIIAPQPGQTVKIVSVQLVQKTGTLGTLTAGLFTGAGGTGNTILAVAAPPAAGQTGYNINGKTSLLTPGAALFNTPTNTIPGTTQVPWPILYLNAGVAAAGTCTVDVWIQAQPFPGE